MSDADRVIAERYPVIAAADRLGAGSRESFMDLQLAGKAGLVTGASQGIGRAIARGLAAEGVRVAIVARRSDLLHQVATDIQRGGGAAPLVIEADLTQSESPQRIATTATQALGRIDILINAAGGSRPIPIDASVESWKE
jgi:3-oxoacyl-[acyl-carrier protein] reductase